MNGFIGMVGGELVFYRLHLLLLVGLSAKLLLWLSIRLCFVYRIFCRYAIVCFERLLMVLLVGLFLLVSGKWL